MLKGFIVALIVIILFASPLILIWAVNTLFNTGIVYNFYTYLAALVLSTPFIHSSSK